MQQPELCTRYDPDLWFPVATRGPGAAAASAQAKSICAVCEVSSACLEVALAMGYDYGIWGGKDEQERRQIRRLRTEKAYHAENLGQTGPRRRTAEAAA